MICHFVLWIIIEYIKFNVKLDNYTNSYKYEPHEKGGNSRFQIATSAIFDASYEKLS